MFPASEQTPLPDGPPPGEVLDALGKVLASRQLRESAQLSSFLDHVVRETLDGRPEGLKEYLLGTRVFGRKPDYDPRRDGIVRVQATSLRKRLDHYYAEEGSGDRVIIDLPRGAYIPTFSYRAEAPADVHVDVLASLNQPVAAQRPAWGMFAAGVLAASLLGLALWLLVPGPVRAHRMVAASPTDCPEIWSSFFAPGAVNLVAVGVPLFWVFDGLYVRDTRVNEPGREKDGRIPDLARILGMSPQVTDNIYTGLGEAVGTSLISNFMAVHGAPVSVASAHAIGQSQLKDKNLVVVSSLRFQTLLREMDLPSAFEFVPVSPEVIRDHKPRKGEPSGYVYQMGAGVSTSYALVSVWPGPNPARRILSIAGVHTWATQAATEYVLDPAHLRELAARFNHDRQSGMPGAKSPFFQVLLKVEGRGDVPQRVDYITHHYVSDGDPSDHRGR